jgi:hypothetical protein
MTIGSFGMLWREACEHDKREAGAARQLRLEWNSEFVDLGALELINFRCPRCHQRYLLYPLFSR